MHHSSKAITFEQKNQMSSMRSAAVIGSGVAGLATAIRLSCQGYAVTVYEAADTPGGKLAELRQGGFRFDLGPSLFTLPELVEELFALCGKKAADYMPYRRLEVITRYFYEDGTVFDAYGDPERFAAEAERVFGEPARQVHRFLRQARELYEITEPVFLRSSLHQASSYFRWQTVKSLLRAYKLDAFRTMHQAHSQAFRHPGLVQLFDRYATYNGSNPYQAPATLKVIPHLEHEKGAFFPREGMYAITKALVRLAEEQGVRFRFGARVEEILLTAGRASAVRVHGERHSHDVIVSNMDIVPTYRKLLPHVKAPEFILSQPRSSSALIFYWGMKGRHEQLDLHNIFFSADYEAEFRHIFQHKTIFRDPTVYVFISAREVPGDAPPDGENWFVMINVPPDTGQDWDVLVRQARRHILEKLSVRLRQDLEARIMSETIFDPRHIEARTSSFGGALYGTSSNNRYAAFLRHANYFGDVPGLYTCGGSVHPGGGIPLCLLSAQITSELIGRREQA